MYLAILQLGVQAVSLDGRFRSCKDNGGAELCLDRIHAAELDTCWAEIVDRLCQGFRSLNWIGFRNSDFDDPGLNALIGAATTGALDSLKGIYLSNTRITDVGFQSFCKAIGEGHFDGLQMLNISDTQVGDGGIEALAFVILRRRLPRLECLNLSGTRITKHGIHSMNHPALAGQLRTLAALDLSHTAIIMGDLRALALASELGYVPVLRYVNLAGSADIIDGRALGSNCADEIFKNVRTRGQWPDLSKLSDRDIRTLRLFYEMAMEIENGARSLREIESGLIQRFNKASKLSKLPRKLTTVQRQRVAADELFAEHFDVRPFNLNDMTNSLLFCRKGNRRAVAGLTPIGKKALDLTRIALEY
ncbi:MAG TPA: hypothetical protein VGN12_07715 [Pirellulales bacterium]